MKLIRLTSDKSVMRALIKGCEVVEVYNGRVTVLHCDSRGAIIDSHCNKFHINTSVAQYYKIKGV